MLDTIDLTKTISRDEYRTRLLELQLAFRDLAFRLYQERRSAVVVYEGWDAAGKGGNIRRATEKLDPRGYHVYAIGAPVGDDALHHYLWRFWRRLIPPDEKQVVIFDRSWYGRVLVERVEGFAPPPVWRRAFREINDFERQLVDEGIVLVKFWLHISRAEQLRRFEQRSQIGYKSWKLTEEDWRNREKWPQYHAAVQDMLLKTSTRTAPWTVVEGNDKRYARVKTLSTLVDALGRSLGGKPRSSGSEGDGSEVGGDPEADVGATS